jgi:hypothetical protein
VQLPADLCEQLALGTADVRGIEHKDDGVGHRYFTVLINDARHGDAKLDIDVLFDGTVQNATVI